MAGNNTNGTSGRFANQFYRNMAASFIAKRYDLKFEYSLEKEFKSMGIEFYKEGKNFYQNCICVNEYNFYKFITSNDFPFLPENVNYNFVLNHIFCQTKEFTLYLKDYFYQKEIQKKIIEANPYESRYNIPPDHNLIKPYIKGNNDVFVHVRLGDVPQYCPSLKYFESILSEIKFDKGYIASDSINHPLCKTLINKYKLIPYLANEVDTIQFANTCKYLVLSNGTFSWMMGFLGYFSTVYYPIMKVVWHGDIYQFPEWIARKY